MGQRSRRSRRRGARRAQGEAHQEAAEAGQEKAAAAKAIEQLADGCQRGRRLVRDHAQGQRLLLHHGQPGPEGQRQDAKQQHPRRKPGPLARCTPNKPRRLHHGQKKTVIVGVDQGHRQQKHTQEIPRIPARKPAHKAQHGKEGQQQKQTERARLLCKTDGKIGRCH